MKRRDFLLQSAAATAALGAGSAILPRLASAAVPMDPVDAAVSRELAMRALDAARSAGATYADFRLAANRSQALGTRERQITFFNDAETYGFGVRVIANGSWGFAASRELNAEEVVRVAQQAVAAGPRQRRRPPAPAGAGPGGARGRRQVVVADGDRPVRRADRGEGGPAAARQRRGAGRAGRPLRQLGDVLHPAGQDLRVHRRLVHRADHLPLVPADADHRGGGGRQRLPEPAAAPTWRRAPWGTSTSATRGWWRTRPAGPRRPWPS